MCAVKSWQSDYVTEKARQKYGMPPPVRVVTPPPPVATNDDALADALAPAPDADPASPCLRFLRLWWASAWCRLRRRWGLGR